MADVDLVVVPGMCLAKEFIATSGKTLLHLAQRKIPVLFLGAGPDRYTADETQMNNEFLAKLHKFALLARDHETFVNFQPFCPLIEEGIDCAFFFRKYIRLPTCRLHLLTLKILTSPKTCITNRK